MPRSGPYCSRAPSEPSARIGKRVTRACHGLGDVDVTLAGVDRHAVREPQIFGDDLSAPAREAEEEAVARWRVDRVHEVRPARAVGDPEPRLPIHEGEVRGGRRAVLGVRRDHLVPAGGRVEPLHRARSDVRHDDPPLGVEADAVRLPAEVPDALLARAGGSDARARATPVRRPDRAVTRHHHPLAPLEVAAGAADCRELDADHDRRCRPRAIARSTSRRSMRARIVARLS